MEGWGIGQTSFVTVIRLYVGGSHCESMCTFFVVCFEAQILVEIEKSEENDKHGTMMYHNLDNLCLLQVLIYEEIDTDRYLMFYTQSTMN